MERALDFLENGDERGEWDKLEHPVCHPYYNEGVYDGDDFVIKKALKIAYLEGLFENAPIRTTTFKAGQGGAVTLTHEPSGISVQGEYHNDRNEWRFKNELKNRLKEKLIDHTLNKTK